MGKYKGRYFLRERVYVTGLYAEVDIYPVFQPPGKRRSKCKPTRAAQERINQRDSERKLDRLVKANFGAGDLAVHLTFRGTPEVKEARSCVRAYLRRIRKQYRRAGTELRYVYVIERGTSGRVDIHLILNAGPMSRDELEEEWEMGIANARRLQWDESGVSAFVAYVAKQGRNKKRRRETYRRWSGSKNLLRPEPAETDGQMTITEARDLAEAITRRGADQIIREVWPGYELVEASATQNTFNRGLYISLRLARPECWGGRPPTARYISGEIGEETA